MLQSPQLEHVSGPKELASIMLGFFFLRRGASLARRKLTSSCLKGTFTLNFDVACLGDLKFQGAPAIKPFIVRPPAPLMVEDAEHVVADPSVIFRW